MKTLSIIMAIIAGIAICLMLKFSLDAIRPVREPETKEEKMQVPYHIKIIDEHEVLLWSDKGDSLTLLFEDAFNLLGETVVFIEE